MSRESTITATVRINAGGTINLNDANKNAKMSKSWVITGTIDPSKLEGVVSSRCGRFVAYDQFLQSWVMVYPGGETMIAEPQMILVEQSWAKANRCLNPIKVEKGTGIRRQKSEQLLLL